MSAKSPIKFVLKFFLRGLLYTIPIAIIVLVLLKLVTYLDGLVRVYFPHLKNIPGLGIIILFVFITIMGVVGSTFIATPIRTYFNRILNKAPLLKTFYSSITDMLNAFVGKKKSFSEPVLVKLTKETDVEKLGFVTERDLSSLGLSSDKIAVYLPHSYGFTGNIFIVPSVNVSPVKAKPADVMKFIVSAGVTKLEKE